MAFSKLIKCGGVGLKRKSCLYIGRDDEILMIPKDEKKIIIDQHQIV